MHNWIKVKMSNLQKDLGFELYKCSYCDVEMNLSGYASQGMPSIHYESCPKNTEADLAAVKINNGTISQSEIIHLRQPCKNRGVELINNQDGTVRINGVEFERSRDVENYLESIPRKDI